MGIYLFMVLSFPLFFISQLVCYKCELSCTHTHIHTDGSKPRRFSDVVDRLSPLHHHDDRRILSAVAKRCVLEAIEESTVFVGIIAAYYAFNMAYPKPILAVLLFIQHYLLVVKDKQPAPIALLNFSHHWIRLLFELYTSARITTTYFLQCYFMYSTIIF